MKFEPALERGILLRRYQRFLADVELPCGNRITMHCPNTGAMLGCAEPGSAVWFSTASDPRRRYRHTLEIVVTAAGEWIGVNSARANAFVEEALRRGCLGELAALNWRREVPIPGETGRFDFAITAADGGLPWFVEVKSVTLSLGAGIGAFPDARSVRASRHLRALSHASEAGHRGALVYCVQHSGVERVRPADHIDPDYGTELRLARAKGVEVFAYRFDVSNTGIVFGGPLPVEL